jgi:hypothetical protein
MSRYFLGIVLAFILSPSISAQKKFDVNHLFYCNENENISRIWMIQNDLALGVRMRDKPAHAVKDIVLIDENRLFVDSLSLVDYYKISTNYYTEVHHVFKSNDTIKVLSGHGQLNLLVIDKKLHILPRKYRGAIDTTDPFFATLKKERLMDIDGVMIGYEREKFNQGKRSSNIPKKDMDNFPNFWAYHFLTKEMVKINPTTDEKTSDLFYPIDNIGFIHDKTKAFRYHVFYYNNEIYFNVSRANKCFIYNVSTKQVRTITFPPLVDKHESYFYFKDNTNDNSYLVKHRKGTYFINTVNLEKGEVHLVSTIEEVPYGFVDGRVHVIREIKERGKTFDCHYLIPVIDANQEEIIFTGEVIISN